MCSSPTERKTGNPCLKCHVTWNVQQGIANTAHCCICSGGQHSLHGGQVIVYACHQVTRLVFFDGISSLPCGTTILDKKKELLSRGHLHYDKHFTKTLSTLLNLVAPSDQGDHLHSHIATDFLRVTTEAPKKRANPETRTLRIILPTSPTGRCCLNIGP